MNPDSSEAPRLKTHFRQQTREAILAAAESTIAEVGVAAARMEDIASSAGVAVGTVYNYFKDRQQLVTALVDLRRAELIDRVDAALTCKEQNSFEDRLHAFVHACLSHFDQHRALFSLMVQEESEIQHNTGAKLSMVRALNVRIEQLLAHDGATGRFQIESKLLPALLFGLLRGVILQSLLGADRDSLTDQVAPLTQFFLRGAGYS
ncbi:MAG TPA: TetR/AcrR family transcriptional regulator [Polyangiaceae bacterium]|nr:TetR/AcrR family transcriptional regulator [Polyangiaceae bacterium]